jgi:glutamate racemase
VRPIGVFDSGVGGLSVLRALRARLPHEHFVYVADSAHAPYGDRSPGYVLTRAAAVAGFLASMRAKALVIACNTASVLAAARLRALHAMPIVAMEPAIKPAALGTRTGVVLVLATTRTARSPSVARLCRSHGQGVRIIVQACPGLAEQVERGDLRGSATRRLLRRFLRAGIDAGADRIVLGCTHYAFLADEIAAIAGPAVTLVEPSDAIARQLARVLGAAEAVPAAETGAMTYFTSGSTPQLRAFLESIGEPFEQVLAWSENGIDSSGADAPFVRR